MFELHLEKTYRLTCAPYKDSNQFAQLCSLIKIFIFCMKQLDCANAQADLNLPWARMLEGTFPDIAAHFLSIDS